MTDLDRARQSINEVDREMVRLFEQRMDAVRLVAEYKKAYGIPVEDSAREEQILKRNTALVGNEDYRSYYADFLRSTMELSKNYQHHFLKGDVHHTRLTLHSNHGCYDIHIGRGLLQRASELFNLNRKVLVVTDSGVPEKYGMTIASQCGEAVMFVFKEGESSKTIDTYSGILRILTENAFTRSDCIVAVGGGVVGDLAGFAAATYMRGVDFYNIPTTLLSQVDSSIGGKTAIDFMGYKNLVGAFYPPNGVLIDPEVLKTLDPRHFTNGMAEVIKMAATHDSQLMDMLESDDFNDDTLDTIITKALSIKIQVVEADERESGLRKVLNFGHTIGHAIESVYAPRLYHGECVAVGMLPMCSASARERLKTVLNVYGLPTAVHCKAEQLIDACRHDKKAGNDTISVVYVPEIGQFEIKRIPFGELENIIREVPLL